MSVQVFHQIIEGCKRCDKGTDPFDIPSVACGHERYENAIQYSVELVPKRDYDALVKLGNDLATAAAWPDDPSGAYSAIRKWKAATDGS